MGRKVGRRTGSPWTSSEGGWPLPSGISPLINLCSPVKYSRLLDEERREESEEEKVTSTRLASLTQAFIQFAFLGSSISNTCRIDFTSQRSSFVLYNNARMRRLLAAFDLQVGKGVYPSLPARDGINFGLLVEPEEWELMFNHLLVFQDLLQECSLGLSLHKIVHFLFGLATAYSRYYNRVRTLKDPLPNLFPLIHARVFLISEVNKVSERLLRILGCEPLENM